MKKTIAIILAAALALSLSALPVSAAEEDPAALDLTASEGLEFESNGDGTCTILSIGVCKDTDIVIPTTSPAGDTVTLIAPRAFEYLEDVDSVTLADYEYEVGERAFQSGEFETLNIIGGAPVLGENAFYDCEDLTAIQFVDSALEIGDYAFQECCDDAAVTFTNCTGIIGKRVFQYDALLSVTFDGCEMEIDENAFYSCEELKAIQFLESDMTVNEYAFQECGDGAALVVSGGTVELDERSFQYSDLDSMSADKAELTVGENAFYSCEDLTSLSFTDSKIDADKYAFQECGDKAVVEMTDCTVELDKRAFQYSSLAAFSVSGGEFTADESALYYCEDLETVIIDCDKVELGEYAISECPDLTSVSICTSGGEVTIGDRAFQYCECLAEVTIGEGLTELGKYVFNGGAENLVITIAGTPYTADSLNDGLN